MKSIIAYIPWLLFAGMLAYAAQSLLNQGFQNQLTAPIQWLALGIATAGYFIGIGLFNRRS